MKFAGNSEKIRHSKFNNSDNMNPDLMTSDMHDQDKKTVLLTGVGGFIGSHFLEFFLQLGWKVIGLDSFRHKGTFCRLDELDGVKEAMHEGRFQYFLHDLTVPLDKNLRHKLWLAMGGQLDYIISMASNSAVERSITDPGECWRNNCDIILNMLEFAREIPPKVFLHISTDEVYGDYNREDDIGFEPYATLLPSNPYAASKAAQEMLAQAYWRTYEVPVVICNTMNNIGERQDTEKFLPRIIQLLSTGKSIPIYTDNQGKIGSRVYLDAQNHADAVRFIIEHCPVPMYAGGTSGYERPAKWNICGDTELNNLELAELVARLMQKELKTELVKARSARPGYDKRYLLDNSGLHQAGWRPLWSFNATLERIVHHTLQSPWWIGSE